MVGTGSLERLPVDKVELDRSNPRIKKFLEMYPQDPTPEQIYFALGAASDDDSDASTSFEKLKSSVIRNGGIIQPIIVNRKKDGRYLCIEGNTRLALYQDLQDRGEKGDWSTIPALVYEDMDDSQANAIRLQLHLVGTRPWDPYSKAKYLYHLRKEELLPFDEVVEFSGGRKKDVVEAINAYESMEKHYRPIAGDENFDTRRFSGFVELQKPGVKEALVVAGFSESDFARWIHEGKLQPLNTIRALSRILRHQKAKELFLKFDAKRAMEVLEKPGIDDRLASASIGQLAIALTYCAMRLPFPEADQIRKEAGSETTQALRDAHAAIEQLLELGSDEE
jgi:ParB-like chromosome segregation protein Spo0J